MKLNLIKCLLLILTISIAFVSCNSKSKVSEEMESNKIENPLEEGYIPATVVLGETCKVRLRATMKDTQSYLIPVNEMGEEFLKDGLEVYVQFIPSRAMQPEGCTGKVISVTDIVLK